MSQDTEEIAALRWHEELERLTRALQGDDATIEVLSHLGAQPESEVLALAYLSYDHKDDHAIVPYSGRSRVAVTVVGGNKA